MGILKIIYIILMGISILGIIAFVIKFQKQRNLGNKEKRLSPPREIFLLGLFESIFCYVFLGYIILFSFDEAGIACSFFCFPMSLIGIWLMLYSLNWRIVLLENGFSFQNIFGKKTFYLFSEIMAVKIVRAGFRIYLKKKSIAVCFFIEGYEDLWSRIKILKIQMRK